MSQTSAPNNKILNEEILLNKNFNNEIFLKYKLLDAEYKLTVMGLSADNWVNLMIQQSFIAE